MYEVQLYKQKTTNLSRTHNTFYHNNYLWPKTDDQKNPEVTLFNSEKQTLHSEIINDDFDIYISLPYRYAYSDTTYPVLFNLNAIISFGITDNVVHILSTLNKEMHVDAGDDSWIGKYLFSKHHYIEIFKQNGKYERTYD